MQANNWGDLFGHRPMRDLARFLTTYNMATQAVAADSNEYDLQTTGGAACVINGIYIPALTADDPYDISAEQTAPTITTESWKLLTAAGVTTWAVDDECYTGTHTAIDQKFYKCLKAHQNDESLEPADNPDLWQAIPNAEGYSLANDFACMFMVTAESDGTLGVWIASTTASATTFVPDLVVPFFDPAVYCVIGFILNDNDNGSAAAVVGAASAGVLWLTDGTIYQVIGPVFPHPNNMPKN